jgi:O-antigen/teichoic acid export membrane protein
LGFRKGCKEASDSLSIGGVARGGVFLFVSSVITYVIGYVYWFLMTRLVDPGVVGIASSVLSLGMLVSGITGLGIPIGVQRFLGQEYSRKDIGRLNAYFWSSFSFSLSSCLFSAIVVWVVALLKIPLMGFSEIMMILAGFVVLFGFSSAIEALFISIVRTDYIASSNLVSSIIKLGSGVFLAYIGLGWFGAVIGVIASLASLLLLELFFSLRALRHLGGVRPHLSAKALKGSAHAGFVSWLPMVAALFAQQISILMIFGFRGSFETGIYFIALTIFNIVRLVPASFTSILLPVISGVGNGRDEILVWKALKICLALGCPLVAFVAINPNIPLSFMGASYLQGTLVLSILCIGLIPLTYIGVINIFVYAKGDYRKVLILGLVTEITRVLLYLLLVPAYGGLGAAFSFSAGSLPGLGIALYISSRAGFTLSHGKSVVAIVAPFTGALSCFLLRLSWFISGVIILFASVVCYARFGVIERDDLSEIARGFASEKTIAKAGQRLGWLLRILYGE